MAAYVVLLRESPVHDPAELQKNAEKGPKDPTVWQMTPLVAYGEQISLEGEPPDGVVILQFPDMSMAKAWYTSDRYQEAVKHRLASAYYRGVIVEGL